MSDQILLISDLHTPYHHIDSFSFLKELHKKYKFRRIINVGDELDGHAMSFHDSDPNLDSAGIELQKGRECLWELWKMFPVMDLLESNHGSLAYRKAKHHGIPRHLILDYNDAVFAERAKNGDLVRPGNRGLGWKWHPSLIVPLKDGRKLKVIHGMSVNTRRNVEQAGMCYAQGHFHSQFEIIYHGTPDFLNFGMTIGCLIDDESLAFAYNKNSMKRPVIGCGGIIDGEPKLFPMVLNKNKRWNGVVP